jgi:hypothetical protein
MQSGGQIKQVVHISKVAVRTTGNIVNDLVTGLSKVIGGVTNGLELVAGAAGSTLNNLSKNLQITSVKVLSRVGDLGLTVSKDLGEVIQIVPILGKPTAYVVKGAGRGIYYVVTSVGNIVGKSVRTVGRVGKEATDLVVFTIASTSTATEKTIEEAGNIVKKVSYSLTSRNKTLGRISNKLRRTLKKSN